MLWAEAKPVGRRLLNWHSIVLHSELIQYPGPLILCIRIFVAFVRELVAGLAKILVIIFTIYLSISLTNFADGKIQSSLKFIDIDATLDDMRQNHIICVIQDILHLKDSTLILIWILQIDRVEALLQRYALGVLAWCRLVAVGLANANLED